jgi:predicted ATP-dependent serine protease
MKHEFKDLTTEELNKIVNKKNKKLYYTMNERKEIAMNQPPMKSIFGSLIHTGEIVLVAGDTGLGKSIFAVGLADAITNNESSYLTLPVEINEAVLYYDFELSHNSILKRYEKKTFSDRFICPDFNTLMEECDGLFSITQLERDIEQTGAKIAIIDNLSAIGLKSMADSDTALTLMREVNRLKIAYGITFIILCHVPKKPNGIPLHINHVGGSKNLTNLSDSVLIIGQSSEEQNRRYIKQLKSRNDEILSRVLIVDIINEPYLDFSFVSWGDERQHLSMDDSVNPKRQKLIKKLKEVFDGKLQMRYTDVVKAYSSINSLSIEAAKKFFQEAKLFNLLIDIDGRWMINQNELV